MQRVLPHLGLARNVRISNVWMLKTADDKTFLVDSGHPAERIVLRIHLWRAGIRGPGDLDGVILTHRHSDHAGNAAWLRKHFGTRVICHAHDAPYLAGETTPAPLVSPESPGWARLLCHIEDRFPARVHVDEVWEDGELREGFRVFHAPGHTEGSMLLHHERTSTLFSGDAIIGGPPTFRIVERLRLSIDDFSNDGIRARASVRDVLHRLPPTETLCSGHGPAVAHDVERKLARLAHRDTLWPRFVR